MHVSRLLHPKALTPALPLSDHPPPHGRAYLRHAARQRDCVCGSLVVCVWLWLQENPIQVLINAIVNSGPREDSTRIGAAGVVRRQAVDVSPFRRVNQALHLISIGVRVTCMPLTSRCVSDPCPRQARDASFRTIKTIAECLADEIVNASKGSSNSYAIKKKDETERVAKANR